MKFKKVISILSAMSVLFGSGALITNATNDVFDYAPVIGEFNYDEEWANIIEKKEAELELNSSQRTLQPTFKRIGGIGHRPQQRGYWCGYAAMESLLDYDYGDMNQYDIANIVYTPDEACPWYLYDGSTRDQFPVVEVLRDYIGYSYIPFPYGQAGTTTLKGSEIASRVKTIICNEHGLMACGTSYPSGESHLPNYPNSTITHWVAIDGYGDSGNTIYIVDPAKSDVVSWSGSIDQYYTVSSDKLAAFASSRGLIW